MLFLRFSVIYFVHSISARALITFVRESWNFFPPSFGDRPVHNNDTDTDTDTDSFTKIVLKRQITDSYREQSRLKANQSRSFNLERNSEKERPKGLKLIEDLIEEADLCGNHGTQSVVRAASFIDQFHWNTAKKEKQKKTNQFLRYFPRKRFACLRQTFEWSVLSLCVFLFHTGLGTFPR